MLYTSSIIENTMIENIYSVINNHLKDSMFYNILGIKPNNKDHKVCINKPIVDEYMFNSESIIPLLNLENTTLLCKERDQESIDTEYRKSTKFITRFKVVTEKGNT